MLMSCSFALDVSCRVSHKLSFLRVSGYLSYFSPPSLSLLCFALIIFFIINCSQLEFYNVVTQNLKSLIKFRQQLVNVKNFLYYCFSGSRNSAAASVRTTICLAKRIQIESSNLTFQSLKSQFVSTKEVY